ncbi:replication protein [Pantoea coffeiphila]|uniref:replication protein n=1 Tax=Pantoea coffeiphila TaxID=1465635 RepID=UPI001961D683|nr:phage replication O-like protein O [Pantoea coffeiphila]
MSNTAEIINFRARTEREEQRVADTDDGYTRLANMLLEEYAGADLTKRQFKVLLAMLRLTYGWNKTMDRISDSQISEIARLPVKRCNEAKLQLVEMNILIQQGRQFGPNKNVSEWRIPQNEGLSLKSGEKLSLKLGGGYPSKQGDTKDIIPKTIKTDPPKAPKGEFSEEVISQAKQVLEYYNELTGTTCRSAEAFAVLLTPRSARAAYTVDDLQLVVRWVVLTWKRRNGTVAKPTNICRVNRFDGYLADAAAWASSYVEIDCAAVVEAYNEIAGDRLPLAELDDDREKAIRDLVTHMTHKNIDAVRAYFKAFVTEARPHYFGENPSGWRANFDFLMKPDTLRKVRERAL